MRNPSVSLAITLTTLVTGFPAMSQADQTAPAIAGMAMPAPQAAPAQAQPAVPAQPAPAVPPSAFAMPPITIDAAEDGVGLAQQAAHSRNLQARIMWIDAGANVGNLNTPEKIQQVVSQIKAAGMNMIVLDVKPIVGETIYPSRYAARLTAWRGATVSPTLDVLGTVLADAHAAGLTVYANMSTFGEGHKFVGRGLAYTHPDWQTTLYTSVRAVAHAGHAEPISAVGDVPTAGTSLGALTATTDLHRNRPGYFVALVNFDARVIALADGGSLSTLGLTVPPEGTALIGTGAAGEWLRTNAIPGEILTYSETPKYIPVVDDPTQTYTMFCDPLNPDVRSHELDIVREVATNYPVDGVVFDDRMRFAGLNADFGRRDREAFEAYIGKKLKWPDDVFRNSAYPGQPAIVGPYFKPWLAWRALQITNWLKDAASLVRTMRPAAQVGVYVGSWYGDYDKLGSNWASSDFVSPFTWGSPEYRAAGYADQLDWITTGCYYYDATVAEANAKHDTPGVTVEAAGQLSNRVVDDAAWTYAGLYAQVYTKNPTQFARAIEAAAASSQGVMVFDLSQIIDYNWWNVLGSAFGSSPAASPNETPGLLASVRQQHAADLAAGKPQPPLPLYQGTENTGL